MLNSGSSCFFLFPLELGSKSSRCSLPGEGLSWRSLGWNAGPACQAREGHSAGIFLSGELCVGVFLGEEGENQFPKELAKKR